MSFILDAIAKSEQERQQQQAPDARSLAFPAAAPVRSRRTAPYVIAGLLLASAILAVIWTQSSKTLTPFAGPGESALPMVPDATGNPQAPVEPGDAPPAVPAETPRPQPATPMLADSAAGGTIARSRPSTDAGTVEAPAAESASDSLAASPLRESSPVSTATATEAEFAAVDSSQASLENGSGPAATAAATPPTEVAAPRRKVSRLSDLPDDVRRVLPSVVFTGHLYSKNPRASYVFIDGGRQVVAGQQITDDLLLDEITPTGVIVEFQGYLIEVGVLQNWSLK